MSKILFLIGFFLLSFVPLLSAENEAKLIRLLDNNSYEILADADKKEVLIPIRFEQGVKPDELQFGVRDIGLGGRHENALIETFKVRLADDKEALVLTVDLKPVLRPGTYSVRLGAQDKEKNLQIIQIQLSIPAAVLRPPGTVVVKRTKRPFSEPDVEGAHLILKETSRRSRLTNVSVVQLGIDTPEAAPAPSEAMLDFSEKNISVSPGGQTVAKGTVTGTFPLGTSKGKLELSASELNNALEVPFEVKTKWDPLVTLLPILIFGLVLGWFMRTYLQSIIKLNEQIVQAFDLVSRLTSLKSRYEDSKFRQDLDRIAVSLYEAINAKDSTKIEQAVKAAEDPLKKALSDLEARRKEFDLAFATLRDKILKPLWSVPEEIKKILDEATKTVAKLLQMSDNGDIAGATKELDSLCKGLTEKVGDKMLLWASKQKENLQNLRKIAPEHSAWPQNISTEIEGVIKALGDLSQFDPNSETRQFLDKIHPLRNKIRGSLEPIKELLKDAITQVGSTLDDQTVTSNFEEKMKELDQNLEKSGFQVERMSDILLNASKEFAEAMSDAILSKADSPNDVKPLLEQGKYWEAAKTVAKQISSVKGILPKLDVETKRLVTVPAAEVKPQVGSSFEPPGPDIPKLEYSETRRAIAFKSLLFSKSIQTFLAGSIIVGGGYFLFADGFIGTFKDSVAAFVWAFGIDIGTNSVIETLKQLKKT